LKGPDYEKIIISVPVNKTASKVMQKGNHFDIKTGSIYHSSVPLKTIKFSGPKEFDLTNKKIGSFIVIGYLGKTCKNKIKTGRWLVKCKCEMYESWSGKALRNKSSIKKCKECLKMYYLKNKNPDIKIKKDKYED